MPRDVAVAHPRAEEVKASAASAGTRTLMVRRLTGLADGAPITHLLSNGRYSVMLTRSEEHTSELQSLMRISYAVFCLKKKNKQQTTRLHQEPIPHIVSC